MQNKQLHIQVPCDLKQVRESRKVLHDFCQGLPLNDEELGNIELAFNEGISNAIDHGSSSNKKMFVDIDLIVKNRYLIIVIKDYGGKEFNPDYYERITLKKDWGRGGRGIYLMRTIMDELAYIFSPNNFTVLYLSKKLPS